MSPKPCSLTASPGPAGPESRQPTGGSKETQSKASQHITQSPCDIQRHVTRSRDPGGRGGTPAAHEAPRRPQPFPWLLRPLRCRYTQGHTGLVSSGGQSLCPLQGSCGYKEDVRTCFRGGPTWRGAQLSWEPTLTFSAFLHRMMRATPGSACLPQNARRVRPCLFVLRESVFLFSASRIGGRQTTDFLSEEK